MEVAIIILALYYVFSLLFVSGFYDKDNIDMGSFGKKLFCLVSLLILCWIIFPVILGTKCRKDYESTE